MDESTINTDEKPGLLIKRFEENIAGVLNCFTHVSDFQRAQSIVDTFNVKSLHRRLNKLADHFPVVHGRWGQGMPWRIYQAEGATDVEFKSSRILPGLYEKSVRTAAIEIKCSDIYGLVHGSLKSPPHKSVTGFKH